MPARDFICISSVRWDSMRQRMQALTAELSLSRRVLYVEPPALVELALFHAGTRSHVANAMRGLRSVGGLRIFTPILPSLTQREPFRTFFQRMMRREIGRAARILEFHSPVVWTWFYPGLSVEALPRGDIAYDCVDEPGLHRMFAGRRTRTTRALFEEVLLARRARWVFATARRLADRLAALNPNTHLLPNAAEPDAFSCPAPEPQDLGGIPRPMAGYVGSIGPWLDVGLLEEVARLLPRMSFVLVGPVMLGAKIGRLRARSNVHLLGSRPHAAVPAYVRAFDVCLIPFHLNDITHSVNPIKFYEYLSAGKPVVATPLAELEPFGSVVDLASDAPSFARAVERRALDPQAGMMQRVEIAGQNTWRQRVQTLLSVIERSR
jgi:glycosyltransferase involved in cell wall biosynthesis